MGPRQCGKTTFARNELSGFDYLDLELPSHYQKLESDIELYLRSRKRPLIIDEAQRCAELFPVLRALVDEKRKVNGQYVLLGSASFALQRQISESLSGRIAFLDLPPLQTNEIYSSSALETHWLKGGFPDALLHGDADRLSFDWFEAYTRTLIERDLPSLGLDFDPLQFRKLWTMCCHFHGQALNMNKIAASMGISGHTVRRYLDILEQSFLLRRLDPYHVNLKKRLVKSPKLYFRDSGLFHYFSRILSSEELMTSPQRGCSFEGYTVEQLIQAVTLEGSGWTPYYFRTSDDIEVDLLLVRGSEKIAIEVKTKLSCCEEDVHGLRKACRLLGISKSFVVALGGESYPMKEGTTCIGARKWMQDGCPAFWNI